MREKDGRGEERGRKKGEWRMRENEKDDGYGKGGKIEVGRKGNGEKRKERMTGEQM